MNGEVNGGSISLAVNGADVSIPDDGGSLLDALRDRLGITSPKDGCSPQGQCGCCTVWIDGSPRVACVTPARRAAGRRVTTLEGLDDAGDWAQAFCAAGASQCGFCTPGIIMRLAALDPAARTRPGAVDKAMLAHLCRCTGWRSIPEAVRLVARGPAVATPARDLDAASRRATIEGRVAQIVSSRVALGGGGFAADTAPAGSLIALRAADGGWVVGETTAEARSLAGKVQGRRSTAPLRWPIEPPVRETAQGWARTLATTWVEPAYLEPDAAWCEPGGEPTSPLANGGAFGGKSSTDVGSAARDLADRHGRPVLAMLTREDTVRLGPKRPPVAVGIAADGTGVARVARPATGADELVAAIAAIAPDVEVELVDVEGPPLSGAMRGAGWAELAVLRSSLGSGPDRVETAEGAHATAVVDPDGVVRVGVSCGDVLDEVVLRSYCTGAAHMALGWVRSEAIAVDDRGDPHDLTIRSFGILRAIDMPPIEIDIEPSSEPPVNGSDAVFAAVAAAAWRHAGFPQRWPAGR